MVASTKIAEARVEGMKVRCISHCTRNKHLTLHTGVQTTTASRKEIDSDASTKSKVIINADIPGDDEDSEEGSSTGSNSILFHATVNALSYKFLCRVWLLIRRR